MKKYNMKLLFIGGDDNTSATCMRTSVTRVTCNKTSVGINIHASVLQCNMTSKLHAKYYEWMDFLEGGLGPKCMGYSLDLNHSLSLFYFLFFLCGA
jgi:hypothetical protein